MKKKRTKIILILLALSILGIVGFAGFRYRERIHTPVTFEISAPNVNSVRVGCYPILHDGEVLIKSEDSIQPLIALLNGKKFAYWGTQSHRNRLADGKTGGYYETYVFCNSVGKELASLSFDYICGGYTLTQDGCIYKLSEDDSKLQVFCEDLIGKAKNGEFTKLTNN